MCRRLHRRGHDRICWVRDYTTAIGDEFCKQTKRPFLTLLLYSHRKLEGEIETIQGMPKTLTLELVAKAQASQKKDEST
jgi:hypothetical protein